MILCNWPSRPGGKGGAGGGRRFWFSGRRGSDITVAASRVSALVPDVYDEKAKGEGRRAVVEAGQSSVMADGDSHHWRG